LHAHAKHYGGPEDRFTLTHVASFCQHTFAEVPSATPFLSLEAYFGPFWTDKLNLNIAIWLEVNPR
jgi:hypothetical protein